jgi:phytanoyl-CoA hydroxylase
MTLVSPSRDLYRFDRAASALPGPDAVDSHAVDFYHRQGYLVVAGVLSPTEVGEAKSALADLLYGRVPGYDGLQPEPEIRDRWGAMTADERVDSVRKIWLFVGHEPRLEALTRHPRIEGILGRLLGEPSRLIQDMALLKPPHIGTEKPWHQDMAYFGYAPPEKLAGVWIALDAATAENGCMHVLPGTHREGPVPHTHARDCQIADDRVEVGRDMMVPLEPGGALFFSPMLHHGTPPNASPHRRWAIQYHYAAHSAVKTDRRDHAALYFDGDRYAGCRGGMGTPLGELQP